MWPYPLHRMEPLATIRTRYSMMRQVICAASAAPWRCYAHAGPGCACWPVHTLWRLGLFRAAHVTLPDAIHITVSTVVTSTASSPMQPQCRRFAVANTPPHAQIVPPTRVAGDWSGGHAQKAYELGRCCTGKLACGIMRCCCSGAPATEFRYSAGKWPRGAQSGLQLTEITLERNPRAPARTRDPAHRKYDGVHLILHSTEAQSLSVRRPAPWRSPSASPVRAR